MELGGTLRTPTGEGCARGDAQTLSFILLDMGNGVTRIEATRLLRGPPCDACILEYSTLAFPLSPRLADAVEVAMETFDAFRASPFAFGLFRAICDNATEFFIW